MNNLNLGELIMIKQLIKQEIDNNKQLRVSEVYRYDKLYKKFEAEAKKAWDIEYSI